MEGIPLALVIRLTAPVVSASVTNFSIVQQFEDQVETRVCQILVYGAH